MTIAFETIILGGRYQIERKLGESERGTTWLAADSETGSAVVVKELLLNQVDGWKSVELFEREGAALRAISHPAVPRYIESMHVEDGGDGSGSRFLIVQAFVDGKDLQQRIDAGRLMDEGEVREFLRQMGEVLGYLHGLSPAVIHRDIKPSNIVFLEDGGRYSLIDFGAVQAIQPDAVGGSTVVGTSGYLAAEQLIGRAVPGSDLYALAATAVHLASGVEPWKLPVVQMRIQYRDRVQLPDGLLDLLDAMLEPSIGLRMGSAGELLAALERVAGGQSYAIEVSADDSGLVRDPDALHPVASRFVLVGMVLMSPFTVLLPAAMTVIVVGMMAMIPVLGGEDVWELMAMLFFVLVVLSVYWMMIGKMFRDFWRSSKRSK